MLDKPPSSSPYPLSPLLPYIWFLLIALLGGIVRYLSMVRSGLKFSWTGLFFNLTTSGFTGLLTVLLCLSTGVNEALTGFFAGMAGYMGGEALKPLEQRFMNFIHVGK